MNRFTIIKRAVLSLLLTLSIGVASVFAMTESGSTVSSEYLLKAAFIYKFINFVEWPAPLLQQDNYYFNLCILGKNPFGEAIYVFEGKEIRNRILRVRLISSPSEAKQCRILYISPSNRKVVKRIINKIASQPVLTIGDFKGFSEKGGMINLIKISNRIRFEINLSSARKAGLRISSKLLRLAVKVYDEKKVSVRRDIKEPVD